MIRDDLGRDIIFGVEVCDDNHTPCTAPDSARKIPFCWSLVSTGSGRTIHSATTVLDEGWSDGTLSGLRNCVVTSGTRGHWCGLAAAVFVVHFIKTNFSFYSAHSWAAVTRQKWRRGWDTDGGCTNDSDRELLVFGKARTGRQQHVLRKQVGFLLLLNCVPGCYFGRHVLL